MTRMCHLVSLVLVLSLPFAVAASPPVTLTIHTVMPPPEWALLERELLRANEAACREFYSRYYDDQGYLLCVERWGGDDGPDDAMETLEGWPLLHALGADASIQQMVHRAWEGHLRQYTRAKTSEVPLAREGMYFKEFPTMFDWQHHNEGLLVFYLMGLSDPDDRQYTRRLRRFAGFYMNEDPGAANYDPQYRIIRSMLNGSRGPLLRQATALDWAGDPIEIENRFAPRHGEHNYQQMLQHFEEYTHVVGDHPMNLMTTSLAMNAFMVTGEEKYRQWVLEYVQAWRQRMIDNHYVIPTNVGLDGTIGGSAEGKWYGGTYGWGFSVTVPQTGAKADRNLAHYGLVGFLNAYLLTGDDSFLDVWRKQRDTINAQQRIVDGQLMYPRMYGDQGWYAYTPQKYQLYDLELWFLSQRAEDRAAIGSHPWLEFLEGKHAAYPVERLQSDLSALRRVVTEMRADESTSDTRLADDPMRFNPARVDGLRELMLGGMPVGKSGALLHSRVRYFDPKAYRAGLPADVAALVERFTGEEMTFQVVNLHSTESRSVIIQAGAYGEHRWEQVAWGDVQSAIEGPWFRVDLGPGAAARFQARMKRYAYAPTLKFPWDPSRQNAQDRGASSASVSTR